MDSIDRDADGGDVVDEVEAVEGEASVEVGEVDEVCEVEDECGEVRLRGRYQGSLVVGWAMSSKSWRKNEGSQDRVRVHMRTGVARAWARLSR